MLSNDRHLRIRMMHHYFFEQRAAASLRQLPEEIETPEEITISERRAKIGELLKRLDDWEADCISKAAAHREALTAMLNEAGEGI